MHTDTARSAALSDEGNIPLACVPGAIPASERSAHFDLLTRLFSVDLRELQRMPNGYAYRFDAQAFDDVARWITNERRCCPFLSFAIELAPDSGPLWIRLTGPAGTHAFLDAELPAPRREIPDHHSPVVQLKLQNGRP